MVARAATALLLTVFLAPYAQGVLLFAAPQAEDAACNCPCCQGKRNPHCACSRHAHEQQRNSGKPQFSELVTPCTCPMGLPASFHSEDLAPPVRATDSIHDATGFHASFRYRGVRFTRFFPANPRRGPPLSGPTC